MKRYSDLLIDPNNAPKEWALQAEEVLKKGYKEYILKNYQVGEEFKEIPLRIYHPDIGTETLVQEKYQEKYTQLLSSEMKTWSELKKIYIERGIWSQEEEKKYLNQRELIEDMAFKVAQYSYRHQLDKKERTKEEQEQFENARKMYDDLMLELDRINLKRMELYQTSIEGQATQYANNFKAIYCIKTEKDDKWIQFWETYEDFKNEKPYNRRAIVTLLSEATFFWSGLPSEILSYLPDSSGIGEEITENDSETT